MQLAAAAYGTAQVPTKELNPTRNPFFLKSRGSVNYIAPSQMA